MTAVLGVDVGGTFTDFFFVHDGVVRVFKRPSTPGDPSVAVVEGMREAGFAPKDVVHGSTVATNALLERRGAVTALVTSAGFRDAIVIGRQARRDMYALEPTRPEPLVPAERRFEAGERVDAQGRMVATLDENELQALVAQVTVCGAESVAVCLLFSFLHPAHERRIAEALRQRGLFVSASVDVLPEYREFERMSTTTVNAFVSPVMARYLDHLQGGLRASGVTELSVMQSDGGSLAADTAGRLAVRTVLSGPAGGVAGAFAAGRAAGYDNLITFDMGGTSTDVSLCPGRVLYRSDLTVDGLPVRTPAVDIHTVGAGGGSIAWLDEGGALRVGPESAGADPGPACYGRGDRPAVTDAQLVLGRLQPEHFLGGRMRIDPLAAEGALARLADAMGADDLDEVAASVIRVANANMERAIRVISVERGYDPRDFTLLAFGGAGPIHACDLAEALAIPRVVVPAHPGVLSAYGMVVADVTRDYVAPVLRRLDTTGIAEDVLTRFKEMERSGREELVTAERGLAGSVVERSLDMRYAGQSYEVEVAADGHDANLWAAAFHAAHEQRYGHGHPGRPVEIVNARVRLRIPRRSLPPQFPLALGAGGRKLVGARPASEAASMPEPVGEVRVWFGRRRATPVYARESLPHGWHVLGPAIVVQMDATTVVKPGWRLSVDAQGNLVLEAH